jgi:hypothetical protein
VHWLTRGGGGWSELDDEPDADVKTDGDQALPATDEGPPRQLGYYSRTTMAAT